MRKGGRWAQNEEKTREKSRRDKDKDQNQINYICLGIYFGRIGKGLEPSDIYKKKKLCERISNVSKTTRRTRGERG
jgi:hypothetical protein